MNLKDVASHWVALHEALGVGAPIADEAGYAQALAAVDELVQAVDGDDAHPLWGLVAVAGERIRAYEDRAHPWPERVLPSSG